MNLSVCPFYCLPLFLSVNRSFCLSVSQFVCLSVSKSVYYLSVYLPVCLSICLSVCVSVSLSVWLPACFSLFGNDRQGRLSSVHFMLYTAHMTWDTSTANHCNPLFFSLGREGGIGWGDGIFHKYYCKIKWQAIHSYSTLKFKILKLKSGLTVASEIVRQDLGPQMGLNFV